MYLKNTVINRPKETKIQRNGSTRYVYYVTATTYYADRKYNMDQRVSIGKMVDGSDTQMIPNENFEKYFPSVLSQVQNYPEPPVFSLTLHVGATVIERKIAERNGLSQILRNIYGSEICSDILNVVTFILTDESAVFQHYPSFMRSHLQIGKSIRSDSYISSRLLHREITDDRIIEMLRQWNKLHINIGRIYIGCDSSNFNSEAEGIDLAQMGHAKDDPTKPQVNLAVAISQDDDTPLSYDLFPGSIIDMTECEQLVSQMYDYGYRDIGLLFDRGYFSEDNVRYLDELGYPFMMMLREDEKVVSELILDNLPNLKDHVECYLDGMEIFGLTVSKELYEKYRQFHIYYDEVKASYSKRRFLNELSATEHSLQDLVGTKLRKNANLSSYRCWFALDIDKKTNILTGFSRRMDRITKRLSLAGTFVIMTTEEMSPDKALSTYRGRDNIEKFFRSIKSGMDFDTPGVHDQVSLAAKIHLMFIAGIIRNELQQTSKKIKEATKNKKCFTVPAMIDDLDQIECTAYESGLYRRRFAFTARQKLIFKYLDIQESIVDTEIENFNSLKPLAGLSYKS